jgi:hypothetical protein
MPGVTIEDAPGETREAREDEEPSTLPAEDITTIFVNVGRRDGIAPADIQRLLTEGAGVGGADIGRIRMRDRITFVDVRKERSEAAIKSLVGKTIGDRTINAEPARKPQAEARSRA